MNSTSTETLHRLALQWAGLCTRYESQPGLLEFYIIQLVQILAFWVPSTILLLLDVCFPVWSNSHKIQSERFQPSPAQIRHCIQHVATNTIVGAGMSFVLGWLGGFQTPIYRISPVLPSKGEVVVEIVYAMFVREVLFYWSHRAFHHPKLYKRFHKQHHLFIAPMAFAAQYAHPLEHIIANTLPILAPLAIRKSHILTLGLYLAWALIETCCAHSGYDFFTWPILGTMHDLHHEKFNVNYGGMAWLDWMCGTSRWYRVSPEKRTNCDIVAGPVATLNEGLIRKAKSS